MRSIEQISQDAHSQRNEQQARLAALAATRHEKLAGFAGLVGKAAAKQDVWLTPETAEEYLTRLGFDLTKI